MPMSVLQIRLEESLKSEVSSLFDQLGIDIPTAVRMFFKRALVEKGLPFEVKTTPSFSTESDLTRLFTALCKANDNAHKNGTAGMSEEEIEKEIQSMHLKRNLTRKRNK